MASGNPLSANLRWTAAKRRPPTPCVTPRRRRTRGCGGGGGGRLRCCLRSPAAGGGATLCVDAPHDRDAAGTLVPDDTLLARRGARPAGVDLHAAGADLDGGLGVGRRATEQRERGQDGAFHGVISRYGSHPTW